MESYHIGVVCWDEAHYRAILTRSFLTTVLANYIQCAYGSWIMKGKSCISFYISLWELKNIIHGDEFNLLV